VNKNFPDLTTNSFFSFVSIPLEMLLYVVEHYKNTSTPVEEMNGDHMATHALTEKKDEERISKGTFLGMSNPKRYFLVGRSSIC